MQSPSQPNPDTHQGLMVAQPLQFSHQSQSCCSHKPHACVLARMTTKAHTGAAGLPAPTDTVQICKFGYCHAQGHCTKRHCGNPIAPTLYTTASCTPNIHDCMRTSCTCAVRHPLGLQLSITEASTWCQTRIMHHASCSRHIHKLSVCSTSGSLIAPALLSPSSQILNCPRGAHHRLLLAPALAPHLRVYCHFEMTALTQLLTFSTEPTVEK